MDSLVVDKVLEGDRSTLIIPQKDLDEGAEELTTTPAPPAIIPQSTSLPTSADVTIPSATPADDTDVTMAAPDDPVHQSNPAELPLANANLSPVLDPARTTMLDSQGFSFFTPEESSNPVNARDSPTVGDGEANPLGSLADVNLPVCTLQTLAGDNDAGQAKLAESEARFKLMGVDNTMLTILPKRQRQGSNKENVAENPNDTTVVPDDDVTGAATRATRMRTAKEPPAKSASTAAKVAGKRKVATQRRSAKKYANLFLYLRLSSTNAITIEQVSRSE